MDHSFNIPGLGELQTENAATTPSIEPEKPSASTDVQASTDTEMTDGHRSGAQEQEQEQTAQGMDTFMDGPVTQEQEQAAQKQHAVIGSTEPRALESTNVQQENGVAVQLDEKMEDHDSLKQEVATSQNETTSGTGTQEAPVDVSSEEPQAQSAKQEDGSAPGSPSVTHALEAALDGLLGPVSKSEEQNEEKPTPEAHINGHAEPTETAPGEGDADANPEWEVDSSPYESSSSDSSSDDDDDDESDVDESKLLGVEETARLLMEADGGSDDEMDGTRAAKQAAGVRTKNELPDEPEPTPQISLSPEDVIAPLGIVQHIVEGTQAVIEALQVGAAVTILDRGSVLCKEDRTVLGVIHDTIATVHKPMYILRFRSEEEAKSAALERGAQVWYSKPHANFVFPSQLRQEKGSDASNLHDEEVGPDEMEYSDDEQEQAHKREKKNRKRGGKGKPNKGDDRGSQAPSAVGDSNLNYGEDDDGTYREVRTAGDVEIREVVVEEEAFKDEAEVAARDKMAVHSNSHTRNLKTLTNRRLRSLWFHHLHQASGHSQYRLCPSLEERLDLPRLLPPQLLAIRCRAGVQPRATRFPSLPYLHQTGHHRSSSNGQRSTQVICHPLEAAYNVLKGAQDAGQCLNPDRGSDLDMDLDPDDPAF
ncbi:hypothetical protein INS49_000940 [Diaporthe citri]|uniref:uncharacterized protein n=1 Tax=Diaporthe citri TaxID=83186 RepID=UPI001C807280|nr:uncharacterized protein INS49_000940 [Diaporthe citri]KAG6366760.1 hypothetical protein INS49_000940 [Diaporthe citri]